MRGPVMCDAVLVIVDLSIWEMPNAGHGML